MTNYATPLMLSRSQKYWQLLALLAVVAPQFDRLPLWLIGLLAFCLLWRSPGMEARLGQPSLLLRFLLLVAGMVGVYYSHRSFIGPEGGVSFLMLCAALKLMESRNQRDWFVLAVLDFFVLSTAFLFSQSMLLTLLVAAMVVVVLMAFLALHQSPTEKIGHTIKKASVLALQALPLMLVLFVFFPRLPPLWTMNLTQNTGRTGISDSMSPGDIARLSESAELAFRVEFQGEAPPASQLYWRGLVLNYYDGQKWIQGDTISWPISANPQSPDYRPPSWVKAGNTNQAPWKYRVILEATDQPWLFSLAIPYSGTKKVLLTRDFRLAYLTPVFSRLVYEVESWSDHYADTEDLPAWLKNQSLQLPATGNEESRQMAKRWHLAAASDESYIQHVLDYFREERFFYTLEPPPLQNNRIDEFLFRSRRGFCEHYASAFVFLMRAAGIPARVVAGYQGGEKSPMDNYWLVRQLDAHAWAEVWLEGKGWVRVDPTSAVAPQRIERGAAQAASQREYWGGSGLSTLKYNNYRLLRSLRNMADFVNYRWYRDVLGYDIENQQGLMKRLLGDEGLLRRLLVMGGLLLVLAGLAFAWTLWGGRTQQHPVDRQYRRYCERMAKLGLSREAGESPQAFAQRIAQEKPALAEEAKEVGRLYAALRYRPAGQRDVLLEKRLKRIAGRWRFWQ